MGVNAMTPSTGQLSPRVAALLEKTRRNRGRLIFALDATASREAMWDLACSLQSKMFEETAKIGGLEVQLVWYRGNGECLHTSWTADAYELAAHMRKIRCEAGQTNIKRVLAHIRSEHQREKVSRNFCRRCMRGNAARALCRRRRVGRAGVLVSRR
jgi:hypothetical protein